MPYIYVLKDRNEVFNASTCGDNCAKWILKPAEADDLTINLRYLMNFGEGAFEKGYPNVVLYLPESFEWIILRSEVIEDNVIVEMLKHPEDYIESKDFSVGSGILGYRWF